MAMRYDPVKAGAKQAASSGSFMDKAIDLALGAGGGTVTLLSGLLAAVLILYSGFVLYDTFSLERAASAGAWDLLQFKPEIFDEYETPLNGASLADVNGNYRAWLTVHDTPIDYPVMQGPDDLYYASHDIYEQVSLTGAIYLAAANSSDFSDSYNVIYGHHMDNGAMFGALDPMKGSESGVIITRNAIYDVQFFARVNTDAYESRIYSVGNRMEAVIDFLRSGGADGVGLGTTVDYFNEAVAAEAVKVVALSTCASASTNGRLVLFGRMILREFLTDTMSPETTERTVVKVWDDQNNAAGIRPASLRVTLLADGAAAAEVTLSEENDWTATVEELPVYGDDGKITYTWSEQEVLGYRQTGYITSGSTTTITNTHRPAPQEPMIIGEYETPLGLNTAGGQAGESFD